MKLKYVSWKTKIRIYKTVMTYIFTGQGTEEGRQRRSKQNYKYFMKNNEQRTRRQIYFWIESQYGGKVKADRGFNRKGKEGSEKDRNKGPVEKTRSRRQWRNIVNHLTC